jgi:hypothetical protein
MNLGKSLFEGVELDLILSLSLVDGLSEDVCLFSDFLSFSVCFRVEVPDFTKKPLDFVILYPN